MRNRIAVFLSLCSSILTLVHIGIPVTAQETSPFDYEPYESVLSQFVNERGFVDYDALDANAQQLNLFIDTLGKLSRPAFEIWDDEEKKAFWINAYNAITLKKIIDNYPIQSVFFKSIMYPKNSVRQISGFWDVKTTPVMGEPMTLDHIENNILRVRFKDPRIHFALVCGAASCPPLRQEPYVASRLDIQLDDQVKRFLNREENLRVDEQKKIVYLSSIFKWYDDDFTEKYKPENNPTGYRDDRYAVLSFIKQYKPDIIGQVLEQEYKIYFTDYDWSLNNQQKE